MKDLFGNVELITLLDIMLDDREIEDQIVKDNAIEKDWWDRKDLVIITVVFYSEEDEIMA